MGVAISTTGDEHRLGFLETCVAHWDKALPDNGVLFVTVDGDAAAVLRAQAVVRDYTLSVFMVGRRLDGEDVSPRQGVAANKNTGIELLMDHARGVEHLFLSDDDCWPRVPHSLTKHTGLGVPHSMVCWGAGRLRGGQIGKAGTKPATDYATWTWPRGVMLYTHRTVVEAVGGMDERFGPGGHEHAEWSRRIHQAGLTPAEFITPYSYAFNSPNGKATRASALWHAEDMPRAGESFDALSRRKRKQSSIGKHSPQEWARIESIMTERDGDTSFVPYRASENGRLSATLSTDLLGQGN